MSRHDPSAQCWESGNVFRGDAGFSEGDHPRDKDGKFGSGAGKSDIRSRESALRSSQIDKSLEDFHRKKGQEAEKANKPEKANLHYQAAHHYGAANTHSIAGRTKEAHASRAFADKKASQAG
jgi:hypothetical protein